MAGYRVGCFMDSSDSYSFIPNPTFGERSKLHPLHPRKFNMEPEKKSLEKGSSSLKNHHFQVPPVKKFGGVGVVGKAPTTCTNSTNQRQRGGQAQAIGEFFLISFTKVELFEKVF